MIFCASVPETQNWFVVHELGFESLGNGAWRLNQVEINWTRKFLGS